MGVCCRGFLLLKSGSKHIEENRSIFLDYLNLFNWIEVKPTEIFHVTSYKCMKSLFRNKIVLQSNVSSSCDSFLNSVFSHGTYNKLGS